jgi:outer membrane protein assembly factor BamB
MKQITGTHRRQIGRLLCRFGITLMAIAWATVSMAQSSGTAQPIKFGDAVRTQANWPQVGYNNARTSYNPLEKVLSVSTVRRLKQEWTFQTHGIAFGPAVMNGILYAGDGDEYLYAVNSSNGALVWKTFIGDGGAAWPTVVNGTVYAGSGVDHGYFYALNAATGAIVWKFRPGGGVFNSAVVANGKVYFGANDGLVYALDAATGELAWTFPTGNLTTLSDPTVANGKLYIVGGTVNGDTLYALDAATGAQVWTFTTINAFTAPVAANGKIFLGENDFPVGAFIYALDPATGANLWTLNLGNQGAVGGMAVAKGVVYADATDGTDGFLALDAATGHKVWGGAMPAGNPIVANGVIYGLGFNRTGQLIVLNASNGKVLKILSTGGNNVSLAMADGKVYVTGWLGDMKLHAYGLGK